MRELLEVLCDELWFVIGNDPQFGQGDHHATAIRTLTLISLFLCGCVEAVVLTQRGWACATWFLGLGALTAWIVYPFTAKSIGLGAPLLVTRAILMIFYYRKNVRRS